MKKRPNVTVKLIFRYRDKTLILKDKNGIFTIPGGRIEWEESVFEALDRELIEELNYPLKITPELFDVWNYISKNRKRHSIFIYYIYQFDEKPKFSSPEKLQILWLTKKEMIQMHIINNKKFLNKIFNWEKQ